MKDVNKPFIVMQIWSNWSNLDEHPYYAKYRKLPHPPPPHTHTHAPPPPPATPPPPSPETIRKLLGLKVSKVRLWAVLNRS